MYKNFLDAFVHTYYVEILALLPSLLILSGLMFTVAIDSYVGKEQKRTVMILLVLVFSLIAQNYAEYLLKTSVRNIFLRRLTASYGYNVRPAILLCFLHIIRPSRKFTWEWWLIGVNILLYTASVFWNICYTIYENNLFGRGIPGLGYTCLVTSLILLGELLYDSVTEFHPVRRRETVIPIFVTLLIPAGYLLDNNVGMIPQPVSFLTIVIVVSCSLYYGWLHLQFVRAHERELQASQRIQIMMSQIRPHFLYNALGAIEELCTSDPLKAQETTEKFSRYLRGNMDSLSRMEPIPFEKELSHTRLYLDMEQVRFRDALQVRYQIECMDFSLPALTLEPLAENAVRHGVREKADGRGTVTILSRDGGDHYAVSVTDDGPGFDPGKMPDDDSHIGIRNVRDRLERMCGGKLVIDSEPGSGTTVTIMIPKEDAHADIRH